MGSLTSLLERIKLDLRKQLGNHPKFRNLGAFDSLVPVVGNGLTMIAAALSEEVPYSWESWMRDAVSATGRPPSYIESLKRRGYELPEILSWALDEAGDDEARKGIWRSLCNAVMRLEPSAVHHALIQMASRIAVTNYDDLIECAAAQASRYHRENVVVVPAERKTWSDSPLDGSVRIYKLCGSMPRPDKDGIRARETEIEGWLARNGPAETIATSERYRHFGYLAPAELKQKFGELYDLFNRRQTLVLFLGLGVYAGELVLIRLLHELDPDVANKLTLVVAPPGDPLYRFRQLGIEPLRLPIGVVASPRRRTLAFLALLELLLDGVACTNRKAAERAIEDGYEKCGTNPLLNVKLYSTAPVVLSVGQVAKMRVIGLRKAAAQEAALRPAKASAGPDGVPEHLITDQVHGQAGAPALVWDAIGLPSSLVSEIGDDALGGDVLDRLSRTEWIDFDGVRQVVPEKGTETSSGLATETLTSVTWFGVRTVFDSVRFDEPRGGRLALEQAPFVPLIYATKVFWTQLADSLKGTGADLLPLIVFETGGTGSMKAEAWVASTHGIILASPMAALKWFYLGADLGPRAIDAAEAWARELELKLPGDETGRYHQYHKFLSALRKAKLPAFLNVHWPNARALVVTLGELGAIYWERTTSWSEPIWCVPQTFLSGDNGTLPLEEIRDAVGCGDCGRAGFVASLACSIGFELVKPKQNLPTGAIDHAVGWLNWFGLQKVRFFGLERYLKFIKDRAKDLKTTLPSSGRPVRTGQRKAFGSGQWEVAMAFERASPSDGILHKRLEDFTRDFLKPVCEQEKGVEIVRKRARDWAKKRGFEPSE